VWLPAVTVTAENEIRVDGKPLPEPERARLWRFHKPAGLVTTHKDEKGRATVFGALPAELPRLVSIGRLDLNSEGLLLLTNDGALACRLELPATGWVRRYKVRVHGFVDSKRLAALARGTTVDGIAYGPIRAQLERQQGSNAWITLSLQEGKNREVRRVLEHLGYPVTRLIRLAYGPFQLGHLARGAIEEVLKKVLEEQLGELPVLGRVIASASPLAVDRDGIPAEEVERERRIAEQQFAESGKPESLREKIVQGKVDSFYKQHTLMSQEYVRDNKKTIGDLVKELSAKVGENIVVKRFARFQLGQE